MKWEEDRKETLAIAELRLALAGALSWLADRLLCWADELERGSRR